MAPYLSTSDEEPIDTAALLRVGTIAAVDVGTGLVEVAIGDIRTAPIPFSTGRQGKTRIWSPPSIGEQVLLLCPGGDIAQGIALGAIAQNAFPLAGATLRELIAFDDGAQLSYDPQAHILAFELPAGAAFRIVAKGGVAIDGDVEIAGKLTATGDVVADTISLTDHRHKDVQAGAALSGKPQ
ncbi:phage baseplate assembly protein V [Croceicoccus sp. YJ47]|uniref:phage baseplate assembly protein V n=1 Tax=Croceicoccus sp. YJ47 TaxID=2798724 RepID=UPI001921569B|nr:phage baseplate assembly protein V [Croceicoccus sp. YJ47]QQN73161.1 phage baseplate assembly protein V [Croceicoccus sp. YJ47]